MSTIAFFLRKNITDDCYEHDKAEIEKTLHEIGFTFNRHESPRTIWWSVFNGSYYIDEDGEHSPITFNINLIQHTEGYIRQYQGESYVENIYFDCFGCNGYDMNGERAPDSCALLLKFLHKYFEYYPDAYFRIDNYYSKNYIDEQYERGNWNGWC